MMFEDVGHIAMEEAPDRTAAAIDAFLGEASRRPREPGR